MKEGYMVETNLIKHLWSWVSVDFYHSWIYQHILNTSWFLWVIAGSTFGLNMIGPVLIWKITSSKTGG
jgi:hypothetical protein